MGQKKFWKLDRNVSKEEERSFHGGMQENQDLESRRSNIAKKKLSKCDEEVLEVK